MTGIGEEGEERSIIGAMPTGRQADLAVADAGAFAEQWDRIDSLIEGQVLETVRNAELLEDGAEGDLNGFGRGGLNGLADRQAGGAGKAMNAGLDHAFVESVAFFKRVGLACAPMIEPLEEVGGDGLVEQLQFGLIIGFVILLGMESGGGQGLGAFQIFGEGLAPIDEVEDLHNAGGGIGGRIHDRAEGRDLKSGIEGRLEVETDVTLAGLVGEAEDGLHLIHAKQVAAVEFASGVIAEGGEDIGGPLGEDAEFVWIVEGEHVLESLNQVGVGAGLVGHILVGSPLGDPAIVHDDNFVGIADGGEPVGDDEGRATAAAQIVVNFLFDERVEGAGGFIEEEDGRISGEGAGDLHSLGLAAGEIATGLLDLGGVAMLAGGKDLMDAGIAGGLKNILHGDGFIPEGEVFADGAIEEASVLIDESEGVGKNGARDLLDGLIVEEDLAGPRLVEAGDETADGGFAATAGSDQSDAFAWFEEEGEAIEERRLEGIIAEDEIADFHASGKAWFRTRNRLRGGGGRGGKQGIGRLLENIIEPIEAALDRIEFGGQLDDLVKRGQEGEGHGLKGDQHADGNLAGDDQMGSEDEDRNGGEGGEESGDDGDEGGNDCFILSGIDDMGVVTGPFGKDLGFGAAGLDGFDGIDGAGDVGIGATDAGEEEVADLATLMGEADDQADIEDGGGEADHGKRHGVIKHKPEIGDDHEQIGDGSGDLAGQQIGDFVIMFEPLGEITGEALAVEADWEAEQVIEKAATLKNGQFGAQADHEALAQGAEGEDKDGGDEHPDQHGAKPVMELLDQNFVDKDFGEDGDGEERDDEEQLSGENGGEGEAILAQTLAEAAPWTRGVAGRFKVGVRFDDEGDPGEGGMKLLHADAAVADRGIINPCVMAGKAFEDDEVVKIPVEDKRAGEFGEVAWLAAKPLGGKVVAAGGLKDIGSLAAIAGDPAGVAEFLERAMGAVVGHDHSEAGGTALQGFHLQDCGGATAGGALHGGVGLHSPMIVLRRKGKTMVAGRRDKATTETSQRVPLRSWTGAPPAEVH